MIFVGKYWSVSVRSECAINTSLEYDGGHYYRYLGIISDVLMSVKRTEDSLKKLQQRGRRSHDTVGGTTSVSDDDKIRLQLSLDVEAFVNQVNWHITGMTIFGHYY